jgi:hypothetical protein
MINLWPFDRPVESLTGYLRAGAEPGLWLARLDAAAEPVARFFDAANALLALDRPAPLSVDWALRGLRGIAADEISTPVPRDAGRVPAPQRSPSIAHRVPRRLNGVEVDRDVRPPRGAGPSGAIAAFAPTRLTTGQLFRLSDRLPGPPTAPMAVDSMDPSPMRSTDSISRLLTSWFGAEMPGERHPSSPIPASDGAVRDLITRLAARLNLDLPVHAHSHGRDRPIGPAPRIDDAPASPRPQAATTHGTRSAEAGRRRTRRSQTATAQPVERFRAERRIVAHAFAHPIAGPEAPLEMLSASAKLAVALLPAAERTSPLGATHSAVAAYVPASLATVTATSTPTAPAVRAGVERAVRDSAAAGGKVTAPRAGQMVGTAAAWEPVLPLLTRLVESDSSEATTIADVGVQHRRDTRSPATERAPARVENVVNVTVHLADRTADERELAEILAGILVDQARRHGIDVG